MKFPNGFSEKFEQLREYYPIDKDSNEFIHRDRLTSAQRKDIVRRMRSEARALIEHANALEIERRWVAKRMPFMKGMHTD